MSEILTNINVLCPICKSKLKVKFYTFYDHDGEISDVEIEHNCPKGCLYDEGQIKQIESEIDKQLGDMAKD